MIRVVEMSALGRAIDPVAGTGAQTVSGIMEAPRRAVSDEIGQIQHYERRISRRGRFGLERRLSGTKR